VPLHRYTGPTVTYGALITAVDGDGNATAVAPYTVSGGAVCELAQAPDDGHWRPATSGTPQLADNDPARIAAADQGAATADEPAAPPADSSARRRAGRRSAAPPAAPTPPDPPAGPPADGSPATTDEPGKE
jgi:hypothetical protein